MHKKITFDDILKNRIIPVITADTVNEGLGITKALVDAGINIVEITLRTKDSLEIIESISINIPEVIVGGGTILNEDQFHMAVKHGASFIVSPGFNLELLEVTNEYDVPFIPGAITPSEILALKTKNFNYLKFFPASGFNALSILKSYENVFPDVKFCATGGISLDNIKAYFELKNVANVGTSLFVNKEIIKNNNYSFITTLAKKAVDAIR